MAESSKENTVTGGGAPAFAKTMIETVRNWGKDDSNGAEEEAEASTDDSYEKGIQDEEANTASMPGANLVGNFKNAMDQMEAEEETARKEAREAELSDAVRKGKELVG